MARRRQTTGLPKKDRKKDETPESPSLVDNLLGNPSSRAEREASWNQLIQRFVAGVVGLIVIIILGILIYDQVIVPQLNVATVNGENITVREFRQRLDFERALTLQNANIRFSQLQQQAQAFGMDVNQLAQNDQQFTRWQQELSADDILGNRVIDDMVEDVLIRQEFESRGLTLDDAQIEIARQGFFGFDATEVAMIGTPATATTEPTTAPTALVSPTPSNTPAPTNTPTMVPSPVVDPEATGEVDAEVTEQPTIPPSPTVSQTEAFEDFEESVEVFSDSIVDAEASRSAIEAFWEREATRNAVVDAIVGEIETAEFANARHILVETEAEANEVVTALSAGESFALLAQARSLDTGSGSRGGELGWQALDLYVTPFADAIREGTIGEVIGPVESEFGFHVIQVIDTEERDVDETTVTQVEQSRFGNWLQDRVETAEADDAITINNNWPDFID